jgi:hypothetical protein
MIVGVHGLADETLRLHEYSPVFDTEPFAAHERFFVDEVPARRPSVASERPNCRDVGHRTFIQRDRHMLP